MLHTIFLADVTAAQEVIKKIENYEKIRYYTNNQMFHISFFLY